MRSADVLQRCLDAGMPADMAALAVKALAPLEHKLLMTAVVDGDLYALHRRPHAESDLYVITDVVGDLYAYSTEKAARADFHAMFSSRAHAGRAAA